MRATCLKCHLDILDQEDQFEANRIGVPYCCCTFASTGPVEAKVQAKDTHEIYVMCVDSLDPNELDDGRGTCSVTFYCNVETARAFGGRLWEQLQVTIEQPTGQMSPTTAKIMQVQEAAAMQARIDATMKPLEEGLEHAVTHARSLLKSQNPSQEGIEKP